METLTKRLVAAALMLPMPNACAETQAASNMITAAAAISLYKIHCRGEIPAVVVATVNTTIREYGESRVVDRGTPAITITLPIQKPGAPDTLLRMRSAPF